MKAKQFVKQHHFDAYHEEILKLGFTLDNSIRDQQGCIGTAIYSLKPYITLEFNTHQCVFMLRNMFESKKKRGDCKRYKGFKSMVDGLKLLTEARYVSEQTKKKEDVYNREHKERLTYQGKILSEMLQQGFSLSKACKEAKLEYVYGKFLIEEGFVKC